MDEAQSLEAVATILGEISAKPFDLSLHLRHIELAKTLDDLESQITAFQMASQFLAVVDDIWLPFIDAKEKSVDLETQEGVEELLGTYALAEADYLCEYSWQPTGISFQRTNILAIPILQKHLNYVLEQYAKYEGEEKVPKPEALGELFSTTWTRAALQEIVSKGIEHLTEVSQMPTSSYLRMLKPSGRAIFSSTHNATGSWNSWTRRPHKMHPC